MCQHGSLPCLTWLLCEPQGHLSGAAVFTRRVITGKEVVLTIEVGPVFLICLPDCYLQLSFKSDP